MVFLSGVIITMLMFYGQKEFLVYALCIALVAELVNITIINNLLKSKASKLASSHAQASEKLKEMLWSTQEKEEEFRNKDLLQRDEIAILKKALDQQGHKLKASEKKVAELQEQLKRASKPSSAPGKLSREDLTLY